VRKSRGLVRWKKRPLAGSGLCKHPPESPETFNSAAPEWKLPAEVAGKAGARGAHVQGAGSRSRLGSLGAWASPGHVSEGCGGEGAGVALLWGGLTDCGCSGTAVWELNLPPEPLGGGVSPIFRCSSLCLPPQGKEKFLAILNKYMEIHGTVYYETQRPPEVPAFVKNHGLLPQHEFQQLLRKAKVGEGHPGRPRDPAHCPPLISQQGGLGCLEK